MAGEEAVDELPHQPRVGHVLDVGADGARHPLAEGGAGPVLPLHRRVERDLDRRHPPRRADPLRRVAQRHRELGVGGLAAELLRQEPRDAGHADQRRILVERDPHRPRLLGQRLEHRLTHPPDGVRNELHAVVGVELAHRLEQSLVPDRDQLGELEPVPLVPLHVGDDEPEVGRHQPLGGRLVTQLGQPGESSLLVDVGDHGKLLDVVQVLIE